ncbi:MAG: beta-ketoacyl-ACP synthase II [Candidatus Wallbacteria bacterium]|nr:beta-ketoacyl-ACP synthase II [Candidatus Wallbacteria bacterium]
MRRVVITGIGVISPFGTGNDVFWNSLSAGISATRRIQSFDPSNHDSQVAGEVLDFNPENFVERKEVRRLDRFSQFAVAAGKLALADSRIKPENLNPERSGAILGTGIGGISTLEAQCRVLMEKGPSKVSAFLVPMMISNMASGNLAIYLGLKGINYIIASACASGTHAVGEAFHKIRDNQADLIFSGGVEAAITPLTVAGFGSMKALSTCNDKPETASRPFELHRNGFVIAEGGAVLILEELELAKKRGARIYAEIAGYGATDDAFHITQPAPEGEGACRAMKLTLSDAHLLPENIEYINAHGTSTHYNDLNEARAIKSLFGEHAKKLKISSNKSMIGHLLGAAGAVEAAATALTLLHGLIPPTINYNQPDPECDLDFVPNKAIAIPVKTAISNSFGFGGHNACLAFKKYE